MGSVNELPLEFCNRGYDSQKVVRVKMALGRKRLEANKIHVKNLVRLLLK